MLKTHPAPSVRLSGAWFQLGLTQELHLIGERGEKVVSGTRSTHFALRVDDIVAWEQHLLKTDAVAGPRKQRPDGAWQIFLCDPDGHFIELCTPPK